MHHQIIQCTIKTRQQCPNTLTSVLPYHPCKIRNIGTLQVTQQPAHDVGVTNYKTHISTRQTHGLVTYQTCRNTPCATGTGMLCALTSLHITRPSTSPSTSPSPFTQLDNESEGIFQLSLTRSDAKNAIGRQFLRELAEALGNVTRERTTRCLLVRSNVDGVFCAGADLKERAGMTQQETHEFVSLLRGTFKQLEVLG